MKLSLPTPLAPHALPCFSATLNNAQGQKESKKKGIAHLARFSKRAASLNLIFGSS